MFKAFFQLEKIFSRQKKVKSMFYTTGMFGLFIWICLRNFLQFLFSKFQLNVFFRIVIHIFKFFQHIRGENLTQNLMLIQEVAFLFKRNNVHSAATTHFTGARRYMSGFRSGQVRSSQVRFGQVSS